MRSEEWWKGRTIHIAPNTPYYKMVLIVFIYDSAALLNFHALHLHS